MVYEKCLSCLAGALLLSACATVTHAPTAAPAPPQPIGALIAAADEAARLGQGEKADSLLHAAAAAYPADKEPWLRLAQRGLESKHYRDALDNALEVLARDGDDRAAHIIAVISGARIANASALQLVRGPVWSGAQRAEALDAARQLHANLNDPASRSAPRNNPPAIPVAGAAPPSATRALPHVPGGPDLTPLQKLEEMRKNARGIPAN